MLKAKPEKNQTGGIKNTTIEHENTKEEKKMSFSSSFEGRGRE